MTQEELDEKEAKKEAKKEQKKNENKRNAANNAQALRTAAAVASKVPEVHVAAVGNAVLLADKVTAGLATKAAGHALNVANKVNPLKKPTQGIINKTMESGIGQLAGAIASKKLDADSAKEAANAAKQAADAKKNADTAKQAADAKKAADTAKQNADAKNNTTSKPQATKEQKNNTNSNGNKAANSENQDEEKKKTPILLLIILALVILPIILVLSLPLMLVGFLSPITEHKITGGFGSYAYGQTCTEVTVINTDCDSNNQNCTNRYNGNVESEDYIAGVVAAESQGNTNPEYLKLLSVIVRTNFIENVNDNCIVEGNSNFLNYIDVNASTNSSEVKQAVADTKNLVTISNDSLVSVDYGYGIIVNEDSTNYYISNEIDSEGNEKTQAIPKSWADNQTMFKDYLSNWQTSNETSTKLSLIGSLYLITNKNYTYDTVVRYYYEDTVEILENKMILGGINGFVNPTRTIYCTSAFGYRIHPVNNKKEYHSGLDIGIPGGEPIYAVKDGIITKAVTNVNAINACSYGYGNYVVIDHGDGTKTLYAHMKYGSVPNNVYVGAEVRQGQQIGAVGSTGCSTGNHLHYEVTFNGERVDPADYMDLTEAKGKCKN